VNSELIALIQANSVQKVQHLGTNPKRQWM